MARLTNQERTLLCHMSEHNSSFTKDELAFALDTGVDNIQRIMTKLRKSGLVSTMYGKWYLTDKGKEAIHIGVNVYDDASPFSKSEVDDDDYLTILSYSTDLISNWIGEIDTDYLKVMTALYAYKRGIILPVGKKGSAEIKDLEEKSVKLLNIIEHVRSFNREESSALS